MIPVTPYPTEYRDPWIDEHGFLRFQIGMKRPSLVKITEIFRHAGELTADGPRRLIIDGRAMRIAPPAKAWTLATYRLGSIATAVAFLFSDMSPVEVWKYQKGIGMMMIPTRVFEEEADAVAWLQSFND